MERSAPCSQIGPLVARLPQQRDQPLALAQPIDADLMRALRKVAERGEELRHLLRVGLMAVDGKAEGGLGHEEVAGHEFEGIAGRVAVALVVAGDHGALALIFDHHLGGAEDVARRYEAEGHVPDLSAPRHRPAPERGRMTAGPEAQAHDGERIRRGQHRAMAGPRMVRMAVGDDGARHRGMRIDEEVARHAIEALPVRAGARSGKLGDDGMTGTMSCAAQGFASGQAKTGSLVEGLPAKTGGRVRST